MRHSQPLSSFTIFPSSPLSLWRTASCPQIADEIYRQLSVVTSIGTGERPHDVFVVVHDLTQHARRMSRSFLTIESISICRAITKMLNFPAFVGRAVNPARGGRLNTMLS